MVYFILSTLMHCEYIHIYIFFEDFDSNKNKIYFLYLMVLTRCQVKK